MNDNASENKVRRFGKVTLMTQVMGLRSSLSDMSEWDPYLSFMIESVIARMGHPTAP